MADLARFHDAQRDTFKHAMNELRAGRKRSHWIWYVFPQIAGLGSSSMAAQYAIDGVDEARAYLADDVLKQRYMDAIGAVYEQAVAKKTPLTTLMGSHIDALKLVSSLTLFAPLLDGDGRTRADAVLDAAQAQGFPRCAHTLAATS